MSQIEGDDFASAMQEWATATGNANPNEPGTDVPNPGMPETPPEPSVATTEAAPTEAAPEPVMPAAPVPERTWEKVIERDRAAQQALAEAKQLKSQYSEGYIAKDDLAQDFKVNPIAVIRQLAGDDFDFAQLSEDSWHESKGAEAAPTYRALKQAREAQLAANKALRGNKTTPVIQPEEVEQSEVSQEVWNDYFSSVETYISTDAKAKYPTLGAFAELNMQRAMQISVNAANELAQQPGRTSVPTPDEVAAHAEKMMNDERALWSKVGGQPSEQAAPTPNTQAVVAQPTTLTNNQAQVQPPRTQPNKSDMDDWVEAVRASNPNISEEHARAMYRP